MLLEWINKKYLNERKISEINKLFLKSKPYPNFALADFFNENKLLKIKKAVLKEKFERIEKDLFSLSHTKDLISSRNKTINEFYKFLSSQEFIDLMKKLTSEKLSLKIDIQSHIMEQGDYLLFHDDKLEGRKIAYIVYLSKLGAKDGGRLQLYVIKNPIKPIKSIKPIFNSFACFKVSRKSLHTVEEIMSEKKRLTIGGWFYGN